MERKHATVLALTFVLVGLMFFSVDTPLTTQQEVDTVIHEAPEIIEQIAAEPVPQEPLRLNVVENGGYEEWDSGAHSPEAWVAQASAYVKSDSAYTDVVATGTYAGFAESQGNVIAYGSSYLYNSLGYTTTTLIEPGISLSFNWNTLANPDLQLGAETYLYLQTDNGAGTPFNINYYLSSGNTGHTNSSNYGHILINETVNQWNNFDRNVTEDFIDVFGAGSLTSESYVRSIWFYASSPTSATNKIQVVIDDVELNNGTYSGWVTNGNFESGTGNGWQTYSSDAGYIAQSTDSTHGIYSVNASIPSLSGGSAYARCYQWYSTNFGYPVLYPEMNVIELDWKYNDTVGAGLSQYAYLRLNFFNGTTHYVHFYFGYGDDTIHGSNSTTNNYVKMPGFGVRDTWQHSEIDLYEVGIEAGLYNMSIVEVSIYAYQGVVDAGVEILVDDFKMMTYPTSDPTFEYVENWGRYNPFTGWGRFSGSGEVTQSTIAHGGTYSANITVENVEDGLSRNLLYADIDPALSTDFWWRLEDIQDSGTAYAYINIEFLVSGSNRIIRYVLGSSLSTTLSNASETVKYILVDGYNDTGVWYHMARNMTADIENAFSISASDCSLFYIGVHAYAAAGMRTSILVDDLHFKDMTPPTIGSVTPPSSVMYFQNAYVRTIASDVRPGVSEVEVNYTTDDWSSWDIILGTYDIGDWFDAYIPTQPYGTQVDFFVVVTDGCGRFTIDDNGGLDYSYTVGDDVDPTLTITNPVNNTDQSGLLAITADVDDPGSGIEYVRFNPDGSGAVTDNTAPYSQNWNLDDESLGSHFVVVTVRDNAGNEVTKTHYFTVVDTVAPAIDSPDDVEFTVGDTGHIIDWNPTDMRPTTYEIFVEEVSTYTGAWNSSSEHLVVELDGLAVGTYNYTCVVYDEAGLNAVDTVMVTVNEVVTTSTTPTTTTTTDITSETTITSGEPTGGGDLMTPLLIVAGIGVAGILLIVFVVLPKMKKS